MLTRAKDPRNETMSISSFRSVLDYSFLPIHDSTIKYLREKGMWQAADDARNEKNINVITTYEKAYQAAIADATAKKINIVPENKDWTDLWASYSKDIPPIKVEIK